MSDLHLIFPELADRLYFSEPGETFDLGGTDLLVVEPLFRDLPYTRWAFDTRRRVLFAGDGFAFTHEHEARHCGRLTEDCDPTLDIPAMMALVAVSAFHWWNRSTSSRLRLTRWRPSWMYGSVAHADRRSADRAWARSALIRNLEALSEPEHVLRRY